MRVRQPAALDVRAIFAAAHEAIEHPPDDATRELWSRFVAEAFVPSGWHDPPKAGERWFWHASSLCQCPREAILKRAGLATDGVRLESKSAFFIGHLWHALGRMGMHMLDPEATILSEVGGRHREIALAALADTVYQHDGEWLILEWKTESEFAGKHRREEAVNGTSARHEHQVQVTAQAMVLESQELAAPISRAFVAYIGKESGNIDQQPVAITPELREEVVARVTALDDAWTEYAAFGILPLLLPDEERTDKRSGRQFTVAPWQCRPRSEGDPKGLYCQGRFTCMKLAGKLGEENA